MSLTYVPKDDCDTPPPLIRLRIDDAAQNRIVGRDLHLISNTTNSVALSTDGVEYYKYYRFIAEGIEGISLKHNVSLRTEIKNVSIFIQMDKATYKPADTVRFRILVLNNKMTPAALPDNGLNVYIKVSTKHCVEISTFCLFNFTIVDELGCQRQSGQTMEICTNDQRSFLQSIEANRASEAW